MPPAASSMPTVTSGLGPNRGISTMLDRFDAIMIIATMGRKASPVTTGEKPSVSCMKYVTNRKMPKIPQPAIRMDR